MRARDVLAAVAVLVVAVKAVKHGTPLFIRFIGWVIK